jgi:hypothetical protein
VNDECDLLDPIATVVRAHTDEGALVTAYVVLASFVDRNGIASVYTETIDGQRCHETLGLLTFGLAIENRRAAREDDE